MKNLLSSHEAIVVALINLPQRQGSLDEIAQFITKRNLFPERKGIIPLSKQVELRAFQSRGRYWHLFEKIDPYTIKLKDL